MNTSKIHLVVIPLIRHTPLEKVLIWCGRKLQKGIFTLDPNKMSCGGCKRAYYAALEDLKK